jgi:hypothetical protein
MASPTGKSSQQDKKRTSESMPSRTEYKTERVESNFGEANGEHPTWWILIPSAKNAFCFILSAKCAVLAFPMKTSPYLIAGHGKRNQDTQSLF